MYICLQHSLNKKYEAGSICDYDRKVQYCKKVHKILKLNRM